MRALLLAASLVFVLAVGNPDRVHVRVNPEVGFAPLRVTVTIRYVPTERDRQRVIQFLCENMEVRRSVSSLRGEQERASQQFFYTLDGCPQPVQIHVVIQRNDETYIAGDAYVHVRDRFDDGDYEPWQ